MKVRKVKAVKPVTSKKKARRLIPSIPLQAVAGAAASSTGYVDVVEDWSRHCVIAELLDEAQSENTEVDSTITLLEELHKQTQGEIFSRLAECDLLADLSPERNARLVSFEETLRDIFSLPKLAVTG